MKALYLILAFGVCYVTMPATSSGAGASRPGVIIGYATYYTVKSCQREGTSGTLTASGKAYDESLLTCALQFHPRKANGRRVWGQKYRITNLNNGKSIIVEHRDYGPGKKAKSRGVIVDLTPAAFLALGGKLNDGRIKVKVEK